MVIEWLSETAHPTPPTDRVYPLVKNQEYDRVHDWEDRAR